MVRKTPSEIELIDAAYLKPFEYFKKNLHKDVKIALASIPFVRNRYTFLIPYIVGKQFHHICLVYLSVAIVYFADHDIF